MDEKSPAKFAELLQLLVRHESDFIIAGGVAALLAGAPIPTMDLDIVYDTSGTNIERLLAALREIHAHYRDPAGRHIVPDADRLATYRMNLFRTDLGALDLLRLIGDGLTYVDLVERTDEYEAFGVTVRALNVEALIETKEHANRPKDQNALLFLRQILEMRR